MHTLSLKKSQQLSGESIIPVALTSVLTELQKFSLSSCTTLTARCSPWSLGEPLQAL